MYFAKLTILTMLAITLNNMAQVSVESQKVQVFKKEICNTNKTCMGETTEEKNESAEKCCKEEAKCAYGLESLVIEHSGACHPTCYCEVGPGAETEYKGKTQIRVPACDEKCTGKNNELADVFACCDVHGGPNCRTGGSLACNSEPHNKGKVWCDCEEPKSS